MPPVAPTIHPVPDSGKDESQAHGLGARRPPLLGGTGLSMALPDPLMFGSLGTNLSLSMRWAIPWRIWIPLGSFPKLKFTPQKLLASMNSTSKYACAEIGAVTRKLGLELKVVSRDGVKGQSVRSILGEGACRLLYSAVSSVKM